jgi:hypothetical protein
MMQMQFAGAGCRMQGRVGRRRRTLAHMKCVSTKKDVQYICRNAKMPSCLEPYRMLHANRVSLMSEGQRSGACHAALPTVDWACESTVGNTLLDDGPVDRRPATPAVRRVCPDGG